jgi:hypothetical protein
MKEVEFQFLYLRDLHLRAIPVLVPALPRCCSISLVAASAALLLRVPRVFAWNGISLSASSRNPWFNNLDCCFAWLCFFARLRQLILHRARPQATALSINGRSDRI